VRTGGGGAGPGLLEAAGEGGGAGLVALGLAAEVVRLGGLELPLGPVVRHVEAWAPAVGDGAGGGGFFPQLAITKEWPHRRWRASESHS